MRSAATSALNDVSNAPAIASGHASFARRAPRLARAQAMRRAHDEKGQTGGFWSCWIIFKRQFEEAAAKLLLAIQEHPETPVAYRILAACYAHMGRLDEARAIVAKLRAITPQVVQSHLLPYRRPEDRELLLSGLRLAAGEEE
jgi:Flp pilus assembly protein TadD